MRYSIKYIFRKLFFFIIAILMFSWIITMIGEPLRRPGFMVRHYIFMLTPRGTHMDDVREFIWETENWRITSGNSERGFRRTRASQTVFIGDKYIRASIGRPGSSPFVGMVIYWGFDDNDYLIDVHVRRFIAP